MLLVLLLLLLLLLLLFLLLLLLLSLLLVVLSLVLSLLLLLLCVRCSDGAVVGRPYVLAMCASVLATLHGARGVPMELVVLAMVLGARAS